MIRRYDCGEAANRASTGILEGHIGGVNSVTFSPDGSLLAVGCNDKKVRLWDVAAGSVLSEFGGHTGGVASVSFSPDAKTLASGSGDKTVRLWNITNGEPIAILGGHTSDVSSVSFSPDGMTLASGSADGSILLWDMSQYISHSPPNPDFNGDGVVGFGDFVQFAATFGFSQGDSGYDARFDLDGDGTIGLGDFLLFADAFGSGWPSS